MRSKSLKKQSLSLILENNFRLKKLKRLLGPNYQKIIEKLRQGYTISEIAGRYSVHRSFVEEICSYFHPERLTDNPLLGSKTEPYYAEEDFKTPQYNIEDLSESELKILNEIIDGKQQRKHLY